MALLYRFVRVPDRANSHVFTFVVTRSVTRDVERDVTSKEFCCGHHRWAITFSRTDKMLGVYLVWKSTSDFMRVYVDFSFTLLNREHFSVNEGFSGKQVKFTMECPAQGNRNYIPVSELYTRNFTDQNGEFQLELSMGHMRTVFDTEFRLPTPILNFRGGQHTQVPNKLESSYFTFGGFDWNLALYPHGIKEGHARRPRKELEREKKFAEKGTQILDPSKLLRTSPDGARAAPESPSLTRHRHKSPRVKSRSSGERSSPRRSRSYLSGRAQRSRPTYYPADSATNTAPQPRTIPAEGRVSFYLNRCTGFDHQCRVRYSVVLGDGDHRVESGLVDDVSDSDGKSYGWHTTSKYSQLIYKGAIRVHLEMILANTLSEVVSNIIVQPSSSTTAMSIVAQGMTQCYDRDKQGWSIKTDSHSETVRLHMMYKEIQNVPRNHLRYVAWNAYVLRFHETHVEPVPLPGAPFSHYYSQEPMDEGIIIETDIALKELCEDHCPYVSEKGQLRIQVEWEESFLLFQATYHKYDEVGRIHNFQMRYYWKEITALQTENYGLERQLFSYQKSIAFAHSRGTYSDELMSPGEYDATNEEERFFEERAAERKQGAAGSDYA